MRAKDIDTPATLTTFYRSRLAAAERVEIARAAWLEGIAGYDALYARGTVLLRDLRGFLYGALGRTAPELADFGLSPPRAATQTPEQKAAAVAKRLATRRARGTMGPKARLAIT